MHEEYSDPKGTDFTAPIQRLIEALKDKPAPKYIFFIWAGKGGPIQQLVASGLDKYGIQITSGGNVLAALLGIVTPFCSCSAVPLFIGFVTAGVPLGVTFSFLIAAPMVNEIALGLLYALLGWKIAAIYMGTGLFIAIFAGWVIGRLKLEGHIEEWVTQANTTALSVEEEKLSFYDRIIYGWDAVKEIIGRVWI